MATSTVSRQRSLVRLVGSGTRGCSLQLWSPRRIAADGRKLAELRTFRREVYREFGFLGAAPSGQSAEAADDRAFHLLAQRRANGELVGCIRFVVFEHTTPAASLIEAVLLNSSCTFSIEDTARCRRALSGYFSDWRSDGGPFVQIGGLAVAPSARRSALGPLLCLGGNAFMRAIGSRYGVIFGSQRTSAGGQLYSKAGCAPITFEAGHLPPLPDLSHDDCAVVMRCDPHSVRPDLEADVEALRAGFDGRQPELETHLWRA